MSNISRPFIYILLFIVYLASTVPVGLLLYSAKGWLGWDVSPTGGLHSLTACLAREWQLYQKAQLPSSQMANLPGGTSTRALANHQ